MKKIGPAAVLGLALITGACEDPTSVSSAVLLLGVVVEGVLYHPDAPDGYMDAAPAGLGAQVATVLRRVDCSDGLRRADGSWVSDHCILEDGESNFLSAGTLIFAIDADNYLVAHTTGQQGGAWLMLKEAPTRPLRSAWSSAAWAPSG